MLRQPSDEKSLPKCIFFTKYGIDSFWQINKKLNFILILCRYYKYLLVLECSQGKESETDSQWRCFLKGVSSSHIILTFIVGNFENLKNLLVDQTHNSNSNENTDNAERASSADSNYSDVPINSSAAVCLPVYVFDCPLGRIINSYVNNIENSVTENEDSYKDFRFKEFITHEYIR